jgi:hypothetical protein
MDTVYIVVLLVLYIMNRLCICRCRPRAIPLFKGG